MSFGDWISRQDGSKAYDPRTTCRWCERNPWNIRADLPRMAFAPRHGAENE